MPMCPPNHSPLYHSTYPSPPYLLTFVSYPRVYLLVYFHVQPLSNPPGYLFTYSPISLPINHLLSCLKTYPKIYQKDLCKQQPLFGAKICAQEETTTTFFSKKIQHYSQVNHLVKNSPQFPRYCFSSRMGWWSEPSLPLIRPSSMTLRQHSLISLSGERDYGERDGWVERGTRTVCETIQSVFPKT